MPWVVLGWGPDWVEDGEERVVAAVKTPEILRLNVEVRGIVELSPEMDEVGDGIANCFVCALEEECIFYRQVEEDELQELGDVAEDVGGSAEHLVGHIVRNVASSTVQN